MPHIISDTALVTATSAPRTWFAAGLRGLVLRWALTNGHTQKGQVMYRTDSRDSGSGFAMGVISGAVVGAGLALLFAPKAGRALRSDLAESMDALRSAIADRYETLAARAGVEIDNLSATVETAADALEARAKAAVDTAARRARSVEPQL